MLEGTLPEMAELSQRTGVGRTTLYRWFGDRERLIGDVLARYLARALEDGYQRSRARGAARIVRAVEALIRETAEREALLRVLRENPHVILGVVMRPGGAVQSRSVSVMTDLIEREVVRGRLTPLFDPPTLAFVLVQVGQLHLWARAATGEEPDIAETIRITATLLNAPQGTG